MSLSVKPSFNRTIAVAEAESVLCLELNVRVGVVNADISKVKRGREAGSAPKRSGKEGHVLWWRELRERVGQKLKGENGNNACKS